MSDPNEPNDPNTKPELSAEAAKFAAQRLYFVYKVLSTAGLLGTVAVTFKYGLGPGLAAAAIYVLLF